MRTNPNAPEMGCFVVTVAVGIALCTIYVILRHLGCNLP